MTEPNAFITLAECVHCVSITIEPQSDNCACGRELYPVSKSVLSGTRIMNTNLEYVEMRRETPIGTTKDQSQP